MATGTQESIGERQAGISHAFGYPVTVSVVIPLQPALQLNTPQKAAVLGNTAVDHGPASTVEQYSSTAQCSMQRSNTSLYSLQHSTIPLRIRDP